MNRTAPWKLKAVSTPKDLKKKKNTTKKSNVKERKKEKHSNNKHSLPVKIKVCYYYLKEPSEEEHRGERLFRSLSGVAPLRLIAAMKNVSAC